MPNTNFTHLHVHSHYSILDGMSKVPDLVDKCLATGMNALALTDHGNMFGIKEFLDYSKKVNGKAKSKLADLKAKLADTTDAAEKQQLEADIAKLEAKPPFKPIVGIETYCARRSLKLKDKNVKAVRAETGREIVVDRSGWHLILLAKNKQGYHNLCHLSSIAFVDGFYDRPRIDKEVLEQYHEGIIACTACIAGEVPQHIMAGNIDEAEKSVQWFKRVFGDDFYIELQRHKTDKPGGATDVFEREQMVNPTLVELARRNGVKIICTNDVHFVEEEHAEAHDRLICLSTGKDFDDPNRLHYTKQEWLKTPQEMAQIFADLPEALENTQEIVDKVETYSIDSGPLMPRFDIPESFGTEEQYRQKFSQQGLFDEFTRNEKGEVVMSQEDAEAKIQKIGGYDKLYRIKLEADYLAKLSWEGAKKRYGEELSDEVVEQITFELHIMKTMGFPGYFLIVQDYIRAAREELDVWVGPGRGSAAGSVVAYCLGITNVDPLKYHLLFERFLNPDRISLPDIDVDFEDCGRGRVLDWVTHKYGKERVAHIITYGTMATKSSVADVGRVQKVPLSVVNQIKKAIPDKFDDFVDPDGNGKTFAQENKKAPKVKLKNCFKLVPELKDALNGYDENISSMLRYAEQLEDTNRQIGMHACGVIIGADDLTNFAPLCTIRDKATNEDVLVTQYDGHVVESVGLIKMDFLGLSTLTLLKEAIKNIKHRFDIEIDIENIPLDDELTYKLFSEGRTVGIFQFESAGMQKYLRDLQPKVFEDLIAMNALYRPGPIQYIPQFIRRAQGTEPITYDIPIMEKYLKETYGITVYQEQVMLLSRLLAGFTRGESDALRKAMGKKIEAILAQLKPKFIEGGKKNGHDAKILEKIWKDWEAFASYAFNKSHATCYAWVAYQTGYLKAHYPAEYMAANLTLSKDTITDVTKFMEECKNMKISVKGPDINGSELNFTVNKEGEILFGLGGIKGVGEAAVESIIGEREAHGPFKNIYDFFERINLSSCNRKTIESLALAGAFDSLGDIIREQFFAPNEKNETGCEMLIRFGNKFQDDKKQEQASLFGDLGLDIDIVKPKLPVVTQRWTDLERLNREREVVGIFLTSHPLDAYKFEMNYIINTKMSDLESSQLEARVGHGFMVGGMVTSVEERVTSKGDPYIRAKVEDMTGMCEFTLFKNDVPRLGPFFRQNAYICIDGMVERSRRDDTPVIRVRNISFLSELLKSRNYKSAMFSLDIESVTQENIELLKELLVDNSAARESGRNFFPVKFFLEDKAAQHKVRLSSQRFSVEPNEKLQQFIENTPGISLTLEKF